MSNLQEVVRYVRSALDNHSVFVHMTAPQLESLLAGLEDRQREIERLKGKVEYKSTIVGYSVELIEDLEKENAAMKKTLEFYAAESTYDLDHLSRHGFIIIDNDGGDKARAVLSTLTKEESA